MLISSAIESISVESLTVSTSIDVILCSSKSSSNESLDCCEMIFGVVELGEKES